MGDEDGGRWRQPLKERRAAGGIDVERLGAEAQRQAGMADRMDREIAGRGRNDIGRQAQGWRHDGSAWSLLMGADGDQALAQVVGGRGFRR